MYSQPLYPVTWFQVAGEPFRPLRSSQLPSVHPTADGWVSLQTTTGQQWLDFCVMLGRDDWLADERMARGTYRTLHRDEIEPVIDAWTSTRATAGVVELATAMRIPVAEVGNGANLPHFDHLVDGGWFTTNAHGFTQPSVPYRLGGGATPASVRRGAGDRARHRTAPRPGRRDADREPTSAVATAPPLPLEGIRVLDLTAFWAGPLIGHACAILGAEVIHVESTKQPDGIRCNTTRTMDEPRWWEWCPMFQGSNTNKLDLAVELDTERGRELFLDLVAVSDVVIDNFSPRVLDQLGLDQDVLLARNPSVIVLRAPGYGVDGAWRERLAYAPTIEAQAGIAWTTGFRDRGPEPPSGIADAFGGSARDVRAAPRPRAPTPHGTRHVPRVPDGRRVAQRRGAAGDRVLGLRSPARTARQSLVDLRAAGRVPHRRRRRRRHPGPVGGRSQSPTTSSGARSRRCSASRSRVGETRMRSTH